MSFSDPERRKSADIWVQSIKVLTLVSWLLFIIALILSYYAAPDKNYGVLRYHGIDIRQFWLSPMTGYLYVILWLSALFSYISIVINRFRSRRKSDHKLYNLILLFIIALAWAVYILFQL